MRSSRRKLLSRLMCFVMGVSCGTNAGAHQKKKSSSNESLNLPEKVVVSSAFFMIYKLMLKPLGSRLLSSSDNNKNKLHVENGYQSGNGEPKDIKYVKIDDENYGGWERRNYIQNVLNSIDKTVDEASGYEWLRTIPNSLDNIRMALHCLFLNYSREHGKGMRNAKLTIGEKIDWSFTCDEENYVSLGDVRKILEWYQNHSDAVFYNSVTPIEKFGFVIQKWAKEMGFKSVEIVMDGVGSYYAGEHYKSSIKVTIHGFKYKLSDNENQILMNKLGLQDGDALDLISDDEEIEEKNMKDKNIILLKYDDDDDEGAY